MNKNTIADIAYVMCQKCDFLELEMKQEIIKILDSQENKCIGIKDVEEIDEDDVLITVYDDESNYAYILRIRAIELDGSNIFMVGDLDGDPGNYWQAFGIEHYYWCLKFIYKNMKEYEKE